MSVNNNRQMNKICQSFQLLLLWLLLWYEWRLQSWMREFPRSANYCGREKELVIKCTRYSHVYTFTYVYIYVGIIMMMLDGLQFVKCIVFMELYLFLFQICTNSVSHLSSLTFYELFYCKPILFSVISQQM